MLLKIRCPHCQRILVAEDWTAGEGRRCPLCGLGFTVPLPSSVTDAATVEQTEVGQPCPRCGATLGISASYCRKCLTDRATGTRLPLSRRLALLGIRKWAMIGAAAAALLIAGAFAANLYWDRVGRSSAARTLASASSAPTVDIAAAVADLLHARSESDRAAAVRTIRGTGGDALSKLAEQLAAQPLDRADREQTRNALAALDLIGASGNASLARPLSGLVAGPPVAQAALCARARLGDVAVADAVARQWQLALQRSLFLRRLLELAPSEVHDASEALRARLDADLRAPTEGLRGLAFSQQQLAPGALETYWQSWSWLGQRRAERVAQALFELAQIGDDASAVPERVRAARRVLESSARALSPAARSAAALVLHQCAPQYASARERIVESLAPDLADASPLARRRATLALSRLTQQPFGRLDADACPADVRPEHWQAAREWTRRQGLATPEAAAPPPAPRLVRRIVSPARQLEADLLREFSAGWPQAEVALARWRNAGLRLTPRVVELANPAQRDAVASSLGAALVLLARYGHNDSLVALELWSVAADQPPWVRSAAGVALAGVCERSGLPKPNLRRLIDPAAFTGDAEGPGWSFWGELLSGAGPNVTRDFAALDGFSDGVRERLLYEARRVAGPN